MAVNHRFGGVIVGTARDSFAASPSPTLEILASATISAVGCLGQTLIQGNNSAGSINLTTETAANIVAAAPNPQVGDYFTLQIVAQQVTIGNTISVLAGAGVTLAGGSPTAHGGTSMIWSVELTNVSSGTEAVTMTRIA